MSGAIERAETMVQPVQAARPRERSGTPAAGAERAVPQLMPYGDPIRVLGTIAVVIGHVCDMVVFNQGASSGDWWVANFVDSATRWAVPVYIMLSGALLLDPKRSEPASQFYRKRLTRLGVAIVFWSAFFLWFSIYWTEWRTPERALVDLFLGQPYAHLHFIYRIMGLYAFTPMFRIFLKHADRRMVSFAVLIALGLGSLNSLMDGILGTELSAFLRFAPFVGYYLAGYLLRDRKIDKKEVAGCWLLACSCILILAGGTGMLVQHFGLKGYPSPGFLLYDFLSPVRVALAISAWLLLTHYFDQNWLGTRTGQLVGRYLAPATLGLYLVHPFFRDLLHVYGYQASWPNIWLGIPLISLLVYLPSALFAMGLMRIPILKKLVI